MPVPDLAFACHAAALCDGKTADAIQVLRMPPGSEFAYAVLATARSERQAYAIIDEVLGYCKGQGIAHRAVEGEAGWYLLDCFSVVVHALGQPQREFYNLEKLWRKAEVVDWRAALGAQPSQDAGR